LAYIADENSGRSCGSFANLAGLREQTA